MAAGRPKTAIDYGLVEDLGSIMCTMNEIASILGCSTSKLEKDEEFMRVYKKALDNGKMSLRRQQYQLAMKGNCTMLIWLGRQYLGQTDKVESEVEEDTNKTIEVKIIKPSEEDKERLKKLEDEIYNGDGNS